VSIQNKVEYILFITLIRFFNLFGIEKARIFAKPLAFVFFNFIPIRKAIVINNLKIAFPNLTIKEIHKLAFQCYCSISITLFEILCIPSLPVEKLKTLMDCPDLGLIKKFYDKGNGLIFLTAHFGNWELGATSMGAQLNIPIHVVVKDQRNPYVSQWLNMMRKKFGNKVTALGVSIKNIYAELKKKNMLGIVGDQRGPRDGMRIKFFNKSTAIYAGTASLSVKTGAPIAVAFIARQPDYRYKVFVEIIEPGLLPGSEEEKILEINQRYFSILESYIRKYPDQWFWMHNIWKY
jgi:Kdo2-lipid IVA lauroyltransferase/acyltransferase